MIKALLIVSTFVAFVSAWSPYTTAPLFRGHNIKNRCPISAFLAQRAFKHRSRMLGKASEIRMAGYVEQVDAEALEVALQDTVEPMVIDFFATWCGPCVMLAPQLEQVANEYAGKVRFLKIDTDQNDAMASSMKIFGLPTLLFIKDGKLLKRIEGALMANKLKAVCDYLFFGAPKPEDEMLRNLLEDDLLV